MNHILPAPRRAVTLTLTLALALAGLLGVLAPQAAHAAAPPVLAPNATTGVTADSLPTAQIDPNGYVVDQAIAGNTVFAGGKFSSGRPAGAAAGQNETPLHNLLAYNITTGALITSFAPNLNGVVWALALSPDKSRLYVGGEFTTVDGNAHNRIVAFDTKTGTVVSAFSPSIGSVAGNAVYAISATSSTVYVGGQFTTANGNARSRLAAFNASNGGLLASWVPKTDGNAVRALVVAPGGNVVAGGQFSTVGTVGGSTTTTAPGSASLDPSTGAAKKWVVNSVVKQSGTSAGVLSLKTDGTNVYGAGFWFGGDGGDFEGIWSANPGDGSVKWLADCHGDTYDTTVANGVVYAASHHHDCANIGGYPDQDPRIEFRGNAYSVDVKGDVQHNKPTKYSDFYGYKAPSVINWFPEFRNASCAQTDCSDRYLSGQPTLTIESTADYVVVGGQFPTVNGGAQQGLARFAKPSIAPDKAGPILSGPYGAAFDSTPVARPVNGNKLRVSWTTNWDADDTQLTYQLFRTDRSTPIYTSSPVTSLWWQRTPMSYVDSSASSGTSTYYVRTTDPDGNTATSAQASGTVQAGTAYSNQVVSDGASSYWRLGESSAQRTATDWVGQSDLALGDGVTQGATPGAVPPGTAATLSGADGASAATQVAVPAPTTFSVEAWFKAPTTSTGGQIIGFGDAATGGSPHHDRQVYLNASGQLVYYVYSAGARSIQTSKAYDDGAWHHVVATLSSQSGMVLYVDGSKAASRAAIKTAQTVTGFWRIGGDRLPVSQTPYFAGALDDVAVYPAALSAAQVANHYTKATGKAPTPAPSAAFTTSCSRLACSYDASSSAATTPQTAGAAPKVATYDWTFGDGASTVSQTSAKATHTYAKSGTFDVALTVTTDDGRSDTVVQDLSAQSNALPTAAFSTKAKGRKLTFDAKGSTDSDGTVTSYRWSFGDGSTSTKKKVSHTYAGTGSYLVTLQVTDNDKGTGSTSKRVSTGGKALASDDFGRTGSGWGAATKGGTWSLDAPGAFSLVDGVGELTLTDPGAAGSASLPKVSTKKANMVAEVSVDKVGTGLGTTVAYDLRRHSGDAYRVKLVLQAKGTAYLVLTRFVDGKEKDVKTVKVAKLTYSAGETLRFRASITSAKKAKIKATVWKAGTKEPKAQLSTKDSTKALRGSGSVGVFGYQARTATSSPVVVGVDNLLVTSS